MPVRIVAFARAWSPAPSGPAQPFLCSKADDLEIILERRERLHCLIEDVVRSVAVRTPFGEIDPVRKIDKRGAQGRASGGDRFLRGTRGGREQLVAQERFESWKRHARPDAL